MKDKEASVTCALTLCQFTVGTYKMHGEGSPVAYGAVCGAPDVSAVALGYWLDARQLAFWRNGALTIIPFNPRGLERRPTTWPRFPWAELAEAADAFAPMAYTGGAFKGFDATYGYVTRALRLLRTETENPDVPIHVIGGVADRLGPEELAGFAAAVADDGNTIGVSLYGWVTTPPAAWRVLAPLSE